MSWNAARDRAQQYRPRRPYRPVAPIGPQITGTFASDTDGISRFQIDHLTWCDHTALSSLMHKSVGNAEDDAEMDEVCRGCGYLRCNCMWVCDACNTTVGQDHDADSCRQRLQDLVVDSYVKREEPIADWVGAGIVVYLLDRWSASGASNDWADMDDSHALWAKHWREVRRHTHVDAPEFKRRLNDFIGLKKAGTSSEDLYAHCMKQMKTSVQAQIKALPAPTANEWLRVGRADTSFTTNTSEIPF